MGSPEGRRVQRREIVTGGAVRRHREKAGDPRKSIVERYSGRDDYMGRFAKAAADLVRQRWVLPEDRATLIQRGEQEWTEATK